MKFYLPPRPPPYNLFSYLFLSTHTLLHSGFLFMRKEKEQNIKGTEVEIDWNTSRVVNRWGRFPKGADTWPHLGFTARSGHLRHAGSYLPFRYHRCSQLTFISEFTGASDTLSSLGAQVQLNQRQRHDKMWISILHGELLHKRPIFIQ